MGQWLRLCAPKTGSLGSILGQGTRSHMPQLKNKNKKNHKKTQVVLVLALVLSRGLNKCYS